LLFNQRWRPKCILTNRATLKLNTLVWMVAGPLIQMRVQDDRVVEPRVSEAIIEIAPAGPRLHFDKGGHNIQKTRAVEIAETLFPWMHEQVGLSAG
jgi:hypothetical protein